VRLGANSVVPYQQLARTLLKLDRFDETKSVLRDAAVRGFDSAYIRSLRFELAFLDGDAGGMAEHLKAAAARPDSYVVLATAARAAISSGQIETSRSLYSQAVAAARAARIEDYAGGLLAEQALTDALLGDQPRARDALQQALSVGKGIETTWNASLAAAFTGNREQAAQLADRYRKAAPPAPDVVQAYGPVLSAGIALANNDGKSALDVLNNAAPYDRVVGPWLPYLRALAHAAVNDRLRASAELRDVIGRKGNLPTHPLHVLARLQLARTLHADGQLADARQAYGDFAAAWRNGDPQHPLLVAANREAAALQK
jgi:hypothetical protein